MDHGELTIGFDIGKIVTECPILPIGCVQLGKPKS